MIRYITLSVLNFFDFFYQKKMISFLKKKIDKIDFFFDVGAHKGETIKLFNDNFEIKNFYSFEASPLTFEVLKNNTNKFKKKYHNTQIFIKNLALGSEKKKIVIKHLIESSSSTIRTINTQSKYFKKKFFFLKKSKHNDLFNELKVDQILLDEFVLENNINNIDFIKIDTEGYELEVLLGAKRILNLTKLLLFEHHYDDMIEKNYFFSDIHHFLTNNNFKKIYKSKMPFRKTFEYIYENKNL